MHTPETPPAELLLAHAASLRALARHLLGDAHAAEDALQDTWLVALERPPKSSVGLGAWLRVVLRSVVSNRRRTETRRTGRESITAKSEVLDDGIDHARSLRTVVDAVLALDEPYRSTVLARFFDDQPPREIARRLGIPIHTVESRLQRALSHLRRILERDFQDRNGGSRRALLLIAGVSSGAASGALASSAGASIVGTNAKAALSGAALLVAAWLVWLVWPHARPSTVPSETRASEIALVEPGPSRTPVAVDRVEDLSETPTTTIAAPARRMPPPPSEELRLLVRVFSAEGAPVRGAAVLAAPRGHTLNDVASTGHDGSADVRLLMTSDRVDLVVAAWHPRWGLSGPWRMSTRSGKTTEIDLALDDTTLPDLDAQAKIGQHALDDYDPAAKPGLQTLMAIVHAPAAGFGSDGVQLVRGEFKSRARAQVLWSLDGAKGGRGFGMSYAGTLPDSRTDLEPARREWEEMRSADSSARSGAGIAGRVLDHGGQPIAGALVIAGPTAGAFDQRTRSDALGAYSLEALPVGELQIFAGAPGRGVARTTIFTARGQTSTWSAQLDPARTYAGRIMTPIATAYGPVRLAWLVVEPERLDVRFTRALPDGSFGFAQLAPGKAILVGSTSRDSLPKLIDKAVEPGPGEQFHEVLTSPFETSVVLRIVDPDANTPREFLRSHAQFHVRVWTTWGVGVERCTWMDFDATPGGFRMSGLAPGTYTLEIGSEYCGWTDFGPIEVKVGSVTDLGGIELPETGFVKVKRMRASAGVRWFVRRGVVETVLEVLERDDDERAHHVPPGNYLFLDPEDRANGVAFTVDVGDSVVVDEDGASYRAKR